MTKALESLSSLTFSLNFFSPLQGGAPSSLRISDLERTNSSSFYRLLLAIATGVTQCICDDSIVTLISFFSQFLENQEAVAQQINYCITNEYH